MNYEKRTNKQGKLYYSFSYWDPVAKKNVRLKKRDVPCDIDSVKKAKQFCKVKEAEFESSKLRIKARLDWQNKYYEFNDLFEEFIGYAKKTALNSSYNHTHYLKNYVFPFFISHKQSNNVNNWPLYYNEFHDWVSTVKPLKGNKKTLSPSTCNHIIGALNAFQKFLYKSNRSIVSIPCSRLKKETIKVRDIDDVLTDEEQRIVCAELDALNTDLKDFVHVLLNTGLRLGEGIGLSVKDLYQGKPAQVIITEGFKKHSLKIYGYLFLNSQVANTAKPTSLNGKVLRKPLKHRKKIDNKFARTIPITDKETFRILALRFNKYKDTPNIKDEDNLLFKGINKNLVSNRLNKIYTLPSLKKFKRKSIHCTRHTFSTYFVGKTNFDYGLCRIVLGHKSIDQTENYVHIFQEINREVLRSSQKSTEMTIPD